jgi:hypothetical protein
VVSYIKILALFGLLLLLGQGPAYGEPRRVASVTTHSSLAKANLFLAAGDYRLPCIYWSSTNFSGCVSGTGDSAWPMRDSG